jgi:hypothetical protein
MRSIPEDGELRRYNAGEDSRVLGMYGVYNVFHDGILGEFDAVRSRSLVPRSLRVPQIDPNALS